MTVNSRNTKERPVKVQIQPLGTNSLLSLGQKRILGTRRFGSWQLFQEVVCTDSNIQEKAQTSLSQQCSAGEPLAKFYATELILEVK